MYNLWIQLLYVVQPIKYKILIVSQNNLETLFEDARQIGITGNEALCLACAITCNNGRCTRYIVCGVRPVRGWSAERSSSLSSFFCFARKISEVFYMSRKALAVTPKSLNFPAQKFFPRVSPFPLSSRSDEPSTNPCSTAHLPCSTLRTWPSDGLRTSALS